MVHDGTMVHGKGHQQWNIGSFSKLTQCGLPLPSRFFN